LLRQSVAVPNRAPFDRIARANPPSKAAFARAVPDTHTGVRTIERSCSRIAWIAEVDERRLALRPKRSGLASPQRRGERAPEAGSQRRSCENGGGLLMTSRESGLAKATCRSGAEGALVDRRRPGPRKSSPLTRRRRNRVWRSHKRSFEASATGGGGRRARQRTSEVTSQTRLAVENAAAGERRRRGCRSLHPHAPSGFLSVCVSWLGPLTAQRAAHEAG
jgi:hypothetical protein